MPGAMLVIFVLLPNKTISMRRGDVVINRVAINNRVRFNQPSHTPERPKSSTLQSSFRGFNSMLISLPSNPRRDHSKSRKKHFVPSRELSKE